MKIFSAIVEHNHGMNVYLAASAEELNDKLAAYCREWWTREMGDDPVPETSEEIMAAYFETTEGVESYCTFAPEEVTA